MSKRYSVNTLIYGKGVRDIEPVTDKDKRVYQLWKETLRKCYDEKFVEKHPEFTGLEIHENWLVFSRFLKDVKKLPNFLPWYKRSKGNFCFSHYLNGVATKLYSNETSSFITRSELATYCRANKQPVQEPTLEPTSEPNLEQEPTQERQLNLFDYINDPYNRAFTTTDIAGNEVYYSSIYVFSQKSGINKDIIYDLLIGDFGEARTYKNLIFKCVEKRD